MSGGCILLVGGGTGGHVFPMIAVADALHALRPDLSLVFVGTRTGLESRVVPARGYPLELIEARPLRGAGLSGAVRGAWCAVRSLGHARSLLKQYQPRVVFSLGGYVAGAVSLAARLEGIPLALMEPNSVPGVANRWVAPFAQRAYTAFPQAERYFSKKIVLSSGVALRSGFTPTPYSPNDTPLRLLVLGGSQGARTLNEAVPQAVSRLSRSVEVVHQVGRGNLAGVQQAYVAQNSPHRINVVEFIDDMPQALSHADLVISRAGASAVSEICAIGRPSLLIPYPFAADDHQSHNAYALQDAGAALCVPAKEATAERLTLSISELMAEPGRLRAMAAAARAWGRPQAAESVARDLLQLGGLVKATEAAPKVSPSTGNDWLQRVGQPTVEAQ